MVQLMRHHPAQSPAERSLPLARAGGLQQSGNAGFDLIALHAAVRANAARDEVGLTQCDRSEVCRGRKSAFLHSAVAPKTQHGELIESFRACVSFEGPPGE